MTQEVRPFPFASLEALSREEVAAAARLRRAAETYAKVERVAGALEDILGERVQVRARRFRAMEAARGADDGVGVMLAAAGDANVPSLRALVELSGPLGAAMVAKALKRSPPRLTDASRVTSPALAGAAAAVVHAAVRRAHAEIAVRVVAAGPAAALARDLARAGPATTAWVSVALGADVFEARVSVSDALSAAAPPRGLGKADLERLGDAPLALPLLFATTLASRADLAALEPGDALVLGEVALSGSDPLAGHVALVAPRAERGVAADLAPDGRLVIGGLIESHPWDGAAMTTHGDSSPTATIDALSEAPVVVRVELGAVEMTAREWAALAPGDVVALGRKVGDPAILRVAGVEIARGELVTVDGEYAVRVVSRASEVSS